MKEEVMEQVKKKIKLYLTGACIYQDGSYPCPIDFETNDEVCLVCLLSIPEILIKAPDQSLPQYIGCEDDKDRFCRALAIEVQQDMTKPKNGAVFMKVLVKEERDAGQGKC